jgi:flavodoxin
MKALVAYDSAYGNTKQVAEAIGGALGLPEDVQVRHVADVQPDQLAGLSLLVAGSPTQKFSPTGGATRFLKGIPRDGLAGVKVAAFDTRFTESEIEKVRILAFLVSIFGYAAETLAKRLQKLGGELLVPPEAFYVGGTEGPLLDGELERAAAWAGQILAAL